MTNVLVVEDDPSIRMAILRLLAMEGFDTINAVNGQAGVQLAQEYEPDLIICDIMMPDGDGYEVLKQLRQHPATAKIPFIFLSAKVDKTDLRQGMNLGADDYLTKPFTREELLGAIAARLNKQSAITQPYIDEMRKAAESLSQLAYRDPLTSLSNRIMLHHRLREALHQARRDQHWVAVFCVSLDRFKAINADLGYARGDLLLQQVAERLNRLYGQEHLVARLGGDEFSVVFKGVTNVQELSDMAQGMLKQLAEPFQLDEHYVQIQTSIGVSLYPEHSNSPDKLLNQADTAMRQAKQQHHGKYQIYHPDLDTLAVERQVMATQLSQALDNHEFDVLYQPQINLITGRIIGVEALLRWQHPQLGLICPDKFIAIAEETGLIVPVGEWVLETVCTQTKQWHTINRLPIKVAVNLSARQFRHPNLIQKVTQVLQSTQIDPQMLVLEMTETSIMEDVDATIANLKALKAMGIQIAIDDFGTGYSSLNYLKQFPIDILKIDQSFVQDITHNSNDAAITKAIIAMAQTLQLKVVAEGVETDGQLNFLRQSGCHVMQGYLFSHAVSATELEQMLVTDKRLERDHSLSLSSMGMMQASSVQLPMP